MTTTPQDTNDDRKRLLERATKIIDERLEKFISETKHFADQNDMQNKVSEFCNTIMVDSGANVPDTFELIYWAQPLGETIYFDKYDIAYTESGKNEVDWRKDTFKEALLHHMGF